MNQPLVQQVRTRAKNRCEYCGIPFPAYRLPYQADHIIARQHGGSTATGSVVRLFHPRDDVWGEHFQLDGALVVGLTAIGRATVHVLAMNEGEFLEVRQALMRERAW